MLLSVSGPCTLIRFYHKKTEQFILPFTLLRFQMKTVIFQQVFTIVLKNTPDWLFWKTRLARLVVVSLFKFLRFWCSHYRYAFLFSSVFISAPFLSAYSFSSVFGWINVNVKPKMELNISVFMQKRISVNRASILLRFLWTYPFILSSRLLLLYCYHYSSYFRTQYHHIDH